MAIRVSNENDEAKRLKRKRERKEKKKRAFPVVQKDTVEFMLVEFSLLVVKVYRNDIQLLISPKIPTVFLFYVKSPPIKVTI